MVVKKCNFIVYLISILCILFFFNCDSPLYYNYIIKNNSSYQIYVNRETYIKEKTSTGYETKTIIDKYIINHNEQIILGDAIKYREKRYGNEIYDFMLEEYNNSGEWKTRFKVSISIDEKRYCKLNSKEYWRFIKLDSSNAEYELMINDEIINSKFD